VRFLGEVVKVTRSRNFLVRLRPPLKEDLKGFKVLLEDLSLVGIVSDIIGPVHEPYALVKILIPLERAKDLIGKRVYLAERGDERILKRGEDRVFY